MKLQTAIDFFAIMKYIFNKYKNFRKAMQDKSNTNHGLTAHYSCRHRKKEKKAK